MATISAYDSASIGVLFSSLNKTTNNTGNAMSGLMGINFSDYATIKNGSYFKLMKAYYGTDASQQVKDAVANKTTATSKDDTKAIARIESASEDMKASADALLESGTKSLFKEERVTNEKGETSIKYDTDKIYKAVSKFVDDYNSVVDEAADSKTSNISGAAERLVRMTGYNEKMLEKIGITIDKDNHLKIDEETFKKADMTTVKSLFNERGSYAYQVSAQASMINYYAENEASKSNTYTNAGTYTYNYNSGTMYSEGI